MNTEILYQKVANNFLVRSRYARASGWLSVLIMLGTAAFIIVTFGAQEYFPRTFGSKLIFSSELFEDGGLKSADVKSLEKISSELTKEDFIEIQKINKKTSDQIAAEIEKAKLDIEELKLKNEADQSQSTLFAITSSITRIGSVLIALYIVQILLSVMRYCFRMADHLASIANATLIGAGDTEKVEAYLKIISSNHIDFGRSPNTPTAELKEIADNAIDKLSKVFNKTST